MARGLKKLYKQRTIDDSLGLAFAKLFSLSARKRDLPKPIKKIALIKLSGIGDAILTLPLLNIAKEEGFNVTVITAKETYPVFQDQPLIDDLILFDIKKMNPLKIMKFINETKKLQIDVAIDTSQTANFSAMLSRSISKSCIGFSNPKTKSRNKLYDNAIQQDPNRHMVFNYMDLAAPLGITYDENETTLFKLAYSEEDVNKLDNLKINGNLIGIHPFSVFPYRNWPKENWAKTIEHLLSSSDARIILLGSKEEKENVDELCKLIDKKNHDRILNLAGELNIKELFALMPRLRMFLAYDGGLMHIAAAQGVPTLGLFGTDTPKRYAPFNAKSAYVYKDLPGHPCIKPYLKEFNPCGKCFKAINVDEVIGKIKFLDNINQSKHKEA